MPFSKPAVVIDNGSYNIKAGFACDNHPVSIFRTVVGRPKNLHGSYGKGHYDVYIGDDAVERVNELDLNHPVIGGKITQWDNMERIWYHVFYKELKAAPEDRAVMLSCAPPTTMKDKVRQCEIFFDTLNVPALCVKTQSVLALYGSGYTTGLSVDLGHDITEINPVYEGGSINYANMLTNLAGYDIYNYLNECFQKRDLDFGKDTSAIINDIRMKHVYITDNCAASRTDYKRTYTLPSGEEIDVSNEAFMAGEIYFQPDLVLGRKTDALPIQEAIVTTALKCDAELQTELYEAIVIHGGIGTMPGLNRRLFLEIQAILNRPVNIVDSTESYCVAWLGGAVYAGLPDTRIWVNKKQFCEQGERIVRNRF